MVTTAMLPGFLLLAGTQGASMADRVVSALTDDLPFAGVHHLQFFDWALLIPYFAVLAILSVYGMHRYEMVRGYLKHKKDRATTAPVLFDQLPRVTIQLPLYNERYVVERLLEQTVKMDYPSELLQIQVLDD